MVNAVNTMIFVAQALRALPLPFTVPMGHAAGCFSEDGMSVSEETAQHLHYLGQETVALARRLAGSPRQDASRVRNAG